MYTLGETSPDEARGAYGELAIGALDILVLYQRVLDMINWFAGEHLGAEEAAGADELTLGAFADARDSELGALFVKLPDQLGVSGGRTHFKSVFTRVSGVRTYIPHSDNMVAQELGGQSTVAIAYYEEHKGRLGNLENKSRLTPNVVHKTLVEAQWLIDQVLWAGVAGGAGSGPLGKQLSVPDSPPPVRPVKS